MDIHNPADDANHLPDMPEAGTGGRGQMLESLASMMWTLTFLSFSSSTVLSEFGSGGAALWTLLFVAAPPFTASLHPLLNGDAGAARATAKYMLYVAAPPACVLFLPATQVVRDALAFAALWLPLELKLLPQIGPTGRVSIWASLTAALSAVNTFTVVRPFASGRPLGYTYKLTPGDLGLALAVAAVVSAALAPLARAMGYGRLVRPRALRPDAQAAIFLGLYFVAVTEELLFRGIAQNLLERSLGLESAAAVAVAALMYGSAHLKSKAGGFGQPNWRAAVLAAVTGVACGLVWRWTDGKATASALTQAGVAYVFRLVFTRPASL
jgi:membrane protease YdiL (CAAX protease family)